MGFGGERMAAAGARLLYPLCQLAIMWLARVLANAGTFLGLAPESKAGRLLEEGAVVSATDPEAMPRTKALFPQLNCHEDPYNALRDADAALICTEWDVYKKLDWERAGKLMARKLVVDGRNLYSPEKMKTLGFEYVSFGRE